MTTIRKSFNIDSKDLDEAKRLSAARGMSLFHYLQLAVKEKNTEASMLDVLTEMESRVARQLSQVRNDIDRTRMEMRDDLDAFAEQLNTQNQKLLKTTDAQIRAFITLLREEAAGQEMSGANTEQWSPGSVPGGNY